MSVSALSNPSLLIQTQQQNDAQAQADAASRANTREDSIEYLQLLLIQLENQNPLEPLETNELTNQLINQAQLEQSIQTNERLDEFIAQLEANTGFSALNYLGNQVEILDNLSPVQNGTAQWSYIVDGSPETVDLVVTDAVGNILHQESGSVGVGPHTFSFDNLASDSPVEDGTGVLLFVNAQDSNGQTLDGLVSSYATIDGVDGSGDTDLLTAGLVTYELRDILKITSGNSSEDNNPQP